MLSYNLAKKLYENGFPQEGSLFAIRERENSPTFIAAFSDVVVGNGEGKYKWIACPTLPELIEACGDGFGYLKMGGDKKFYVEPRLFLGFDTLPWNIGYETPEEAVANLWLELRRLRK